MGLFRILALFLGARSQTSESPEIFPKQSHYIENIDELNIAPLEDLNKATI
jgi:hypothetical protein